MAEPTDKDLDPLERALAMLDQPHLREPGWNAYKAKPIRPECIEEARRTVARLAGEVPIPHLSPCPSGIVEAEWDDHDCALWYLSVEFRGDGRGYEAAVAMIPALRALAGRWGDLHEC